MSLLYKIRLLVTAEKHIIKKREEVAKLLDELLKKLRFNIEDVIKSDLSEVILYGSYARGDFDEESDIDIAVIVDSSRELLRKYRKGLVEIMSNASLEYDVVVNISCIPLKDFEEYKEVLPYYRNIDSEGGENSSVMKSCSAYLISK